MENGRFAFLSSPFGGLEATYDVHLWLIGTRVVDFPINWIFFVRCYGWAATNEYWL